MERLAGGVGGGAGAQVQVWPSAEERGRPVTGHCRLQLDAGEGVPEKRRRVLVWRVWGAVTPGP